MATSKTIKSSGSKPAPERFGKLGWKPDLPDHRDHIYAVTAAVLQKLPPKVDLRTKCPPVYNQGRIGSCTANAIAGAIQFQRRNAKKPQKPDFMPSRLFIYYNERAMEGSIGTDAGAQIRDGIKSVVKQGVCPDALWPYDDTPAASDENPVWAADAVPATKPSAVAYKAAKNYQVISYQRLPRVLNSFRGCLAEGNPFVFGFSVYSSLYGADGMPLSTVPLPGAKDDLIGGHAVLAVGYDDAKQIFIVRNSWGSKAQDKGYFYLPYAYLTDTGLSDDFWTIKAVE
jgi:C1A family cysteine protease